jgi:GT2 family glycosyltransferase
MHETSPSPVGPGAQPFVRGNDWPSLRPDPLGSWEPSRSVSVVIPAHGSSGTLPYTLASLAAQTYPAHLMQVVVVDDGSDPAVSLPSTRPERTTIVRTTKSWGRAHACHVGALEAEGEVLHWLDADMLLHRDEVEAQMRWHHLLDHAVVLGHKTFVDVSEGLPDLDAVGHTVREGRAGELFPGRWTSPHDWVEEYLERTDGLTTSPTMSYLVHVGASASVGRDLYLASGGMDQDLRLGEDVELGYRLSQLGAVFIPDSEARSWHLGLSTLMQQRDVVNRYNRPFVTDRIPNLRHWRTRGRSYTVPWVEVVVDATGHSFEEVRHSVQGALTGSVGDVTVLVVGPWSGLSDERRSPLLDPDRDLRMVRAEFAGEARVRCVDRAARTAFPATYRLRLPAGWSPGRDTVRRLGVEMARRDRGLVSLLLPDGRVGRLERTSAFHRAMRLTGQDADVTRIDEVVDRVSKTWWFEAAEEGFTHLVDSGQTGPAAVAPQEASPPRKAPSRRGATDRAGLGRDEPGAPDAPVPDQAVRTRMVPRLLAHTRMGRRHAEDR